MLPIHFFFFFAISSKPHELEEFARHKKDEQFQQIKDCPILIVI